MNSTPNSGLEYFIGPETVETHNNSKKKPVGTVSTDCMTSLFIYLSFLRTNKNALSGIQCKLQFQEDLYYLYFDSFKNLRSNFKSIQLSDKTNPACKVYELAQASGMKLVQVLLVHTEKFKLDVKYGIVRKTQCS